MILPSCQKSIDLFQESDEGLNTLSFTFNGAPTSVRMRIKGYHTPQIYSGYETGSGVLQIDAIVCADDDKNVMFNYIFMDIPLPKDKPLKEQDISGAMIRTDEAIIHIEDDYSDIEHVIPVINSTWVTIRKYDYSKRICSGSFGCSGVVRGKDGDSYPFEITDGLFDVSFKPELTESNSYIRTAAKQAGFF